METLEFLPVALLQRGAGIFFEELFPLLPKESQLFLSSFQRTPTIGTGTTGRPTAQNEDPKARNEQKNPRGSLKIFFIHSSQTFPSTLPEQGHALQRGPILDRTDGLVRRLGKWQPLLEYIGTIF